MIIAKRRIISFKYFRSYFALGSYITSISIIEEKLSGIWNRTLVSGARPVHFLLSHIIIGSVILGIQFLEHFVFTAFFLVMPETSHNSLVLLALLLTMTGYAGLLFGLMLSTVVKSSLQSFSVAQFFVYPAVLVSGENLKTYDKKQPSHNPCFFSGVIWPFESIPRGLQFVGRILPFHFSSTAFKNILFKNSGILEPNVIMAFVVLSCWIVVELSLCIWFTRQKK